MVGGLVFLAVIEYLAVVTSPTTSPSQVASVTVLGPLCALSLFAAGVVTWWMLYAQIVADTEGLRWRGVLGWKSAKWEDVTDYYYRLPAQSRGGHLHLRASIITASGTLSFNPRTQLLYRTWTEVSALLEKVTREATSAAAKDWSLLGSRPCDPWPHMFRYDTWQNIWTPRFLLASFLAFFVYIFEKSLMQTIQLTGAVGWPMKLALFAPYLMMLLLYGGKMVLIIAQYQGVGRRKSERITADLTGIVFEDRSRRIDANWSDVTSYRMAQGVSITNRYIVETKLGEFDFLSNISDAVLLQEAIRRFATEAAVNEWKPPVNHDALGGEAARWSGGKVGIGARVYHYRTRGNRAVLWLPLMLCFVFGLMAWLASQGQLPGQSVLGLAWSGAGSGLMLLLGYYAYRTCRIESDEEGLTRVTLLGRRRLRWAQIEDYYLTKERGGVVRGRAERISFSPSVVGYEELKAEIAQRATDCGGKAWEKAEELKTSR